MFEVALGCGTLVEFDAVYFSVTLYLKKDHWRVLSITNHDNIEYKATSDTIKTAKDHGEIEFKTTEVLESLKDDIEQFIDGRNQA